MEMQSSINLDKVIQSLQLLAADYEQQVSALPDFVHVTDEIASTFEETYALVDDLVNEGLITSEQRAGLRRMDALLESMSGEEKGFWNLESLRTAEQWKQVRLLAEDILASFQRTKQVPDLFWEQYIPWGRKPLLKQKQMQRSYAATYERTSTCTPTRTASSTRCTKCLVVAASRYASPHV